MTFRCALILCIVLFALSMSVLARTHVFLICGQSNSVGENSDGPTPEDRTSPNIQQLDTCDQTPKLIEASDPLLHYCPGHHIGFGMTFARELNATLPVGDRIVLVAAGLDGTGFSNDNTWSPPNRPGFVAAVNKVNTAMKLAGDDAFFSGLLWHQGEHDAGDNVGYHSLTAKEYLAYFIPMVEAFRNTSFIPTTHERLPVVVGTLLPSWQNNGTFPGRLMVVSALATINQTLPHAQCALGDGLPGDPVYRSGNDNEIIHFTAAGQRIFGRRYFHEYQRIIRQQQAEDAIHAHTQEPQYKRSTSQATRKRNVAVHA